MIDKTIIIDTHCSPIRGVLLLKLCDREMDIMHKHAIRCWTITASNAPCNSHIMSRNMKTHHYTRFTNEYFREIRGDFISVSHMSLWKIHIVFFFYASYTAIWSRDLLSRASYRRMRTLMRVFPRTRFPNWFNPRGLPHAKLSVIGG